MSACFPIMRSLCRSDSACLRASGTTPCVIGHVFTLVASCPRRQRRRAGQRKLRRTSRAHLCVRRCFCFLVPLPSRTQTACSPHEPCHEYCRRSSAPAAAHGSWPRPQVVAGSESVGGCIAASPRSAGVETSFATIPQPFRRKRFAARIKRLTRDLLLLLQKRQCVCVVVPIATAKLKLSIVM